MCNNIVMFFGYVAIGVAACLIVMIIYDCIKNLVDSLRWKIKSRTLHHRLYRYNVSVMIIPIDYHKFMISFKCEGYEDWFFYANAKSWKEIGAVASKNWSRYLAEREEAIDLAEAPDVDLDELFGDSMNGFVSDNLRSATDAMKAMSDAAKAYAESVESSGKSGDSDGDRPGTDDWRTWNNINTPVGTAVKCAGRSGNEPGTDGGDICVGQERKAEEES